MSKTTSNSSYRSQLLTSGSSVITKYVLIAGLAVFALSLTSLCAAQQPASPSNSDSTLVVSPAYKGQTIYVRDFEVDPVAFKQDKGGITGKGFYEVLTETTSGKKPGAVITLSPGVAVVKFVTNKTSPEKTVKQAAATIAEELTKQLKGQTLVAKN